MVVRLAVLNAVLFIATLAGADEPGVGKVHGRLSTHENLTVLEVSGTPAEAGFAHGYLLAERLVRMFDEVILDPRVGVPPEAYEALVRPAVVRHFTWSEAAEAELDGITRGVAARLGPKQARSQKLGRPLDVLDLKVGNTLADWRAMFCSTFSAWGALTEDGETITARNLDYPGTAALRTGQILIVHRVHEKRPWVGVGWPGLIGSYTAMNADGVTIAMHDAEGLRATLAGPATARSLALRFALENAPADGWLTAVETVFRQHRMIVGNNIHVSATCRAGQPPAAIFEYDGNERSQGVTVRRPAESEFVDAVVCTNHMRVRKTSETCGRYRKLADLIGTWQAEDRRLGAEEALRAIRAVANDTTLHSVIFLPAQRQMLVYIPEINPSPIEIDVKALLSSPTTQPAEPMGLSSRMRCPLGD